MEPAQPLPAVPPGYHFQPTHEELIRCYLNPWVATGGQADFHGVVCAADIYAEGPDALTSRFRQHAHGGNWYFLCVARWKDKDGKAGKRRMNRCVEGGGTWHGSAKSRPVAGAGGGGVVGYRQGFEFRDARGRKTAWIMDEYVIGLAAAADDLGLRVLCKVHRSPRATQQAAGETNDVQGVVGSSTKRPVKLLRLQPGVNDAGCSYATSEAGSSKRPRLNGGHGLGTCSVLVAPSLPHEVRCYDYAGALSEPVEQGIMECHGLSVDYDGEPGPSAAAVESVGTKGYDDAGDEHEPSAAAAESAGTGHWRFKEEEADFGVESLVDADALVNEFVDLSSYEEQNTAAGFQGGDDHPINYGQ